MTSGLVLVLALAAADDAGAGAVEGAAPVSMVRPSLLRSATLIRSDNAPRAALLNDGVASTDGDVWDSPRAAILGVGGVIEWDLGVPATVSALRIQADNNDRYLVFGSQDHTNWYPVWVAGPVDLPGVQTRTSNPLNATARFLRLTAEGGDSKYSITELEVFDSQDALRAAQLTRIAPPPPPPPPPAPPFDTGFVVVFAAAGAFVFYFRWVKQVRAAQTATEPKPETPAK